MHSDPEERLSHQRPKKNSYWGIAVVIIAIIAAIYFFSIAQPDTPTDIQAETAAPSLPQVAIKPTPEELPPAPDIPLPLEPEIVPDDAVEQVLTPELTLETSDKELRNDLSGADSSSMLVSVLANNNLIERSAGAIDGFSRGAVPYKALPLKPPAQKFSVQTAGDQLYIDPASYQRYDSYAQTIGELNTATLATLFVKFRPLLEQAYASLGYPGEDFDNALIRTLDRVLATPKVEQPIELVKKEAMYLYADPELESLSEMQKLLLRMGPANINLIKEKAKNLRRTLLDTPKP